MMRRFARLFLAGASLAAGAAWAGPAPAQDSDIVVTGRDMEQQVREFVGALTQAPPRGQLSRFERPACPAAFGIAARDKQAVVDRIRLVARTAGISVGGAKCIPNMLVLVTEDKRAFLEALERRYPNYFGDLPRSEMRRIMREPGPAAAWQLQGPPLDSDGVELPDEDGLRVSRGTRLPSRVTAPGRPQFAAAALVVERKALAGLTTVQLADYASMRLFARTDPARLPDASAPTILKVLDAPSDAEVPITLTSWDLGFLRGLYSGDNTLYAASRRSEMRRAVEKELKPPEKRGD
ncbi:MAG TPA: hypothetical protein VFQ67_07940 [Allosphingosinicella sp.]|jgi:hypothetical protein|nr:hypothetical protein [Allosphingosinicella sp.]